MLKYRKLEPGHLSGPNNFISVGPAILTDGNRDYVSVQLLALNIGE